MQLNRLCCCLLNARAWRREIFILSDQGIRSNAILAAMIFIMHYEHTLDVEWLRNISRSSTVEIRLWGWQATLEQIREHWLLGYGVRTDLQVPLDDPRYIEIGEPFWHPHNVFLSMWYQAGLIGLALLLALVVALVRKLRPLQGDRARLGAPRREVLRSARHSVQHARKSRALLVKENPED